MSLICSTVAVCLYLYLTQTDILLYVMKTHTNIYIYIQIIIFGKQISVQNWKCTHLKSLWKTYKNIFILAWSYIFYFCSNDISTHKEPLFKKVAGCWERFFSSEFQQNIFNYAMFKFPSLQFHQTIALLWLKDESER